VRRIVLGTRGSDLARAQTSMVEAALRRTWPEVEIAIEIITTRGDENSGRVEGPVDPHAGRKGLFTGEIERVLRDGLIDVAVHSAKDLPSDATDGLEICAALPRAAVEDVLIAKSSDNFEALPRGTTIGTGSVRRQHQVRSLRGDLNIVDLRGNVPTRLRKLIANPWEAIVLARAGLERLGFDCSRGELAFDGHMLRVSVLPADKFLPAGGQGIVALQVRSADPETRQLAAALGHAETLLCLRAEREFLRLLQGDCGTPVGVSAAITGGVMTMRAQFFDEEHADPRVAVVRSETATPDPEALGAKLLELING
jgi:hydroxymethylbilane synthase